MKSTAIHLLVQASRWDCTRSIGSVKRAAKVRNRSKSAIQGRQVVNPVPNTFVFTTWMASIGYDHPRPLVHRGLYYFLWRCTVSSLMMDCCIWLFDAYMSVWFFHWRIDFKNNWFCHWRIDFKNDCCIWKVIVAFACLTFWLTYLSVWLFDWRINLILKMIDVIHLNWKKYVNVMLCFLSSSTFTRVNVKRPK